MNVNIKYDNNLTTQDLIELLELHDDIMDEEAFQDKAEAKKTQLENKKGVTLVVGIAIGSLAVTSITALINVLNHFTQKQPKYSFTITDKSGHKEVISNLNAKQAKIIRQRLEEQANDEQIQIKVIRGS
ncbi:hypothetical protein BKI52_20965 [marine bacterium AO1-C]|nr:hypothetical protein BKI52_20965 [marine bacterium AO1-C]